MSGIKDTEIQEDTRKDMEIRRILGFLVNSVRVHFCQKKVKIEDKVSIPEFWFLSTIIRESVSEYL